MALSTLEKILFLKSVPLFSQIPGEEIATLVPLLQEVEIEPGETFIRKGDEGDCLYILVEGEVAVTDGSEENVLLRKMMSKEVIGELAVLSERPRTADCTALSSVVALRIDKKDFWELMYEQPQIPIEIMRVLIQRYV